MQNPSVSDGLDLFKTTHNRPFSFFSNVFMPRSLVRFGGVQNRCWLTNVFMYGSSTQWIGSLLDFVVSLFWFNPFIYLYRNALIEIHEYQADEAVINRFKDPIGYQEILFSQLAVSRSIRVW